MQAGAADDVEMQSILPAEFPSQAKRKSSLHDSEQLPSIRSQGPPDRSCRFKVAIYCAAAVLLLWAAFPMASTRIWHKAASSTHTAVPAPVTADAALSGSQTPEDLSTGKGSGSDSTAGSYAAAAGASPTAAPPAPVPPKDPSDSGASGDADPGMLGLSPTAAPEDAEATALSSGDPWCPLQYPQMSLKELETRRCYLFGGQPNDCKQCRRGFAEHSLDWQQHHPCEFWSQSWRPEPWGRLVCPSWMRRKLQNEWLARNWTEPLQLTPCDLWRFLGPSPNFPGRTLWLVGDSQGYSMFEAVKCFLHGFLTNVTTTDPLEMNPFADAKLSRPLRALASKVGAKCKTLGSSGSLADGRICFMRADKWPNAIKTMALPLLAGVGASPRDILVLNTGLHFSSTYETDLKEMSAWYAKNHASLPFVIWKDTPPQHFDHVLGEYPGGVEPPFKCKPQVEGFLNLTTEHTLLPWYKGTDEKLIEAIGIVAEGGWRNQMANSVFGSSGMAMSLTWNETQRMHLFHRSNGAGYECTHYCMPSAPQVWVHGLVQTLRSHVPRLNAHFGAEELVDVTPPSWPY